MFQPVTPPYYTYPGWSQAKLLANPRQPTVSHVLRPICLSICLGSAVPCLGSGRNRRLSSIMGRLSRSNTMGHGFGILEDTSGPGPYASSDANGPHTFNNVAALEDCDTNSRQRTPEFIDALTDKLKELHIYSPKKNRADRSLLQPVRRRSTRSSIDSKIFPTLQHIREEVEICDGNSSVTSPTQGPVLANLPQETKQDEGIPSSTETRAAVPTSPRQTSDSFEANGSNFCSEGSLIRLLPCGLPTNHISPARNWP